MEKSIDLTCACIANYGTACRKRTRYRLCSNERGDYVTLNTALLGYAVGYVGGDLWLMMILSLSGRGASRCVRGTLEHGWHGNEMAELRITTLRTTPAYNKRSGAREGHSGGPALLCLVTIRLTIESMKL